MAKSLTFIDTSGWYSLFVRTDKYHNSSLGVIKKLQKDYSTFITTDYILDETFTLFKARMIAMQSAKLFEFVESSSFIRLEWISHERFLAAQNFYQKQIDHSYSFTDCTSFVLMKELRMDNVLTQDKHFREAGFNMLL